MTKIKKINAREILDSRGNPTIEAEVHLENNIKAWAQVPSGASTGEFEALELRDEDMNRYNGKGVLKAVHHVNDDIAQLLVGKDVLQQKEIDELMIACDGTENKSRLGANAILAVSLAVCRASAIVSEMPLYKRIAQLHHTENTKMPIPMFNVINGGMHADSGLAIQEYKVVPKGIGTFKEQYRAGAEIFYALKKHLSEQKQAISVGDEGGFAPRFAKNTDPFDVIIKSVQSAGYKMGNDVFIAIDAAANSFYHEKCEHYAFHNEDRAFTTEELLSQYEQWISQYYIMSIEDGLTEYDWNGWQKMYQKFNDKIMIIGDDLIVTNVQRLKKAIELKACNAVLIKPNQIGTITETLACIAHAQDEEMQVIVSHRSGETIDDFIADLAVGVSADYIKTGSLSRGERICKYNRLMTIAENIEL